MSDTGSPAPEEQQQQQQSQSQSPAQTPRGADSGGSAAALGMLPAPVKVQLNELRSENAVLKARLRSTNQELKNTRDLCQRLTLQSARGKKADRSASAHSSGSEAAFKDTAIQTRELKGLRPLSVAIRATGGFAAATPSLTTATTAVQTAIGGKDCIVLPSTGADAQLAAAMQGGMHDEVRRLKAEVLRSHAECASLHHAIQIMKASSASPEHRTGTGGSSSSPGARAMFPGDEDSVPETHSAAANDSHAVAKASHLAAMERIATLTEALKQANESIADLERDLSSARSAAADAAARTSATANQAASQQPVNTTPTSAAVKLNKATITDDAQLDVRLPVAADGFGGGSATASHEDASARVGRSSALEQALAMTRAQLHEALEELSTLKASGAVVRGAGGELAKPGTRAVGVSADLHQPLREMFLARGLEMDGDTIEELLNTRTRHLELVQKTRELEQRALTTTNSAAVKELQQDLDNVRKELTSAHQHIDELHYALELEKRERFNPQNLLQRYGSAEEGSPRREQLVLADDAQKQAAAEIAFLCDTLAATKADAEQLRSQLSQASMERDSALHSFKELKAKTEAVLQGCQDITEATRADADQAIATLTHTLHQKDSEIFGLRGQVAALQRDLEKTTKQLHATEREADAVKQRVATVQSAMSKLREDSNAQATQLREVRAQLAAAHASALSSPRGTAGGETPRSARGYRGGGGSGAAMSGGTANRPRSAGRGSTTGAATTATDASRASADRHEISGLQALQQALDERDSSMSAARRLGDFGSPSPLAHRGGSVSSHGGSPAAHATASPQRSVSRRRVPAEAPVDGLPYDELKAEYEELRSCFLMLAAMAPNAITAREVTDALTAAFEAQKERCAAVERELRKRTTTLQALKKELTATREKVAELEKRTSQAGAMEQRVASLGRHIDKQKRAAVQAATEYHEKEEQLKARIQGLEDELEATRTALAGARQELKEGRELMLSLIGEDQEALAAFMATSNDAASDVTKATPTDQQSLSQQQQ